MRGKGTRVRVTGGSLRLSASDVSNFLACQHLTGLDVRVARGLLNPPGDFDLGFQELVRRGEEHERAVLEQFRSRGLQVAAIPEDPGADAAAATAAAMNSAADVIYQGTLAGRQPGSGTALLGRPDFLVRGRLLPAPDGEPRPGGADFEVVDAKLARSAKGRAVAQIAFYSHLLAQLQGSAPRWMHLALGGGEFSSFKVAGFAAYERQARRVLSDFIAGGDGGGPPATYPDPVEHCAVCRWAARCAARRRTDDDLSLIAGITKGQRQALKAAGVATRRGFAALTALPEVGRASRAPLERAWSQAKLQVASEDSGRVPHELLAPERDDAGDLIGNRGLLALPEPATGDLFFDIEGARFYSENPAEPGLQYLFGIVDTADADASGTPRYHPF